MSDARTARERAEALFTIGPCAENEFAARGILDIRGLGETWSVDEEHEAVALRARLAAPIAAAIEAAARDATEAAAAACEAAAARYERDYERRGDQCDGGAARALDDAARAIRAGGTGGDDGQ